MQLWEREGWESVFARNKLNWDHDHVDFGFKNKRQKWETWTEQKFLAQGTAGIPLFHKAMNGYRILGPNKGDRSMFHLCATSHNLLIKIVSKNE